MEKRNPIISEESSKRDGGRRRGSWDSKAESDCDELVVVSQNRLDDGHHHHQHHANHSSKSNSKVGSMTNSEIINRVDRLYYRHSTSSPEMNSSPSQSVHSTGNESGGNGNGTRTSSRSSSIASPSPVNGLSGGGHRRDSVGTTDSLTNASSNGNCNNTKNERSSSQSPSSSSTTGAAIPLTKNVGVSVNFGKGNVKSNSSSNPAGSQHIIPNGHQHHHPLQLQQQQHISGGGTVTTTASSSSTNPYHNNNGNTAAINLGHGHIGTIAGPPSVSISSGGGHSSGSIGVNHNSSFSMLPAVSALTACTNKGVSSPHNQQQQQHLSIPSPLPYHHRLSPHSPGIPIIHVSQDSTAATGANCANNGSTSPLPSRNDGGSSISGSGMLHTGPSSPVPPGCKRGAHTSSSSEGGLLTPGSNSTNVGSDGSSTTSGSKGEAQSTAGKNMGATGGSSGGGGGSNSTNRIVSQNVNGTLAITGVPSNESELQLFRVLQRANLLSYFDMMIELGGDDVQQLCDAGEEEFLEIMALIGMASKPLHVRRLQKALQEWMTQPNLFQAPVLPPGYPVGSSTLTPAQLQPPLPHLAPLPLGQQAGTRPMSLRSVTANTAGLPLLYPGLGGLPTPSERKSPFAPKPTNQIQSNGVQYIGAGGSSPNHLNPLAPGSVPPLLGGVLNHLSPNNSPHHQHQSRYNHPSLHSIGHHLSGKNNATSAYEKERNNAQLPMMPEIKIPADQLIPSHFLEARMRTEPNSPGSSLASSPHPDSRNSVSPVSASLQDHEVQKLADAAIHLIRSLPPSIAEPKFSAKKKTSGDYELILRLCETDPRRMDEVRRVAAVYGRPDAKRKTYKPLSLHELAINEAAAQLCKHVPALLTKREELLSLSRQVLRDSGLPYSAISSTFSISLLTNGSTSIHNGNNNNDINTRSKYEEINGANNRHLSLPYSARDRDGSSPSEGIGGSGSLFNAFHAAKRFRLDAASGIEIQEYNHGLPLLSTQGSSPSPPTTSNGMQITELPSFPPRRSPSADDHLPSPLELVTVTSDLRKSGSGGGGGGGGNKSPSVSSMDSISPPIRRPFAAQADDLSSGSNGSINGSHFPQGMRISHQAMHNIPSIKITSIPVSGGSISIMNHNGTSATGTGTNHHFGHHHHHHHHFNSNPYHGMKMPIKSEPTVN